MSTTQPRGATSPSPDAEAPHKTHNWWIWISAVLCAIAVGLLVWGLSTRSDLNGSQQQVAQLESQAKQSQDASAAAAADVKTAYAEMEKQLGSTGEDLAAAEKEVQAAEQRAAQAEQDAKNAQNDAQAAKEQATAASGQNAKASAQVDEANAEASQAKADAKAAEAKNEVVADCAKSSAAALGQLSEGSDPEAQAAAVEKQLQAISAECSSALSGS